MKILQHFIHCCALLWQAMARFCEFPASGRKQLRLCGKCEASTGFLDECPPLPQLKCSRGMLLRLAVSGWNKSPYIFASCGNYNVAMPVVSIILNVLSSHLVKILSEQRKIVMVEAGERQHHNLRPHARKVD